MTKLALAAMVFSALWLTVRRAPRRRAIVEQGLPDPDGRDRAAARGSEGLCIPRDRAREERERTIANSMDDLIEGRICTNCYGD